MNARKLLSVWGLKWNPFANELPIEALLATPRLESFTWRVEQLAEEGGFALITGESGLGKSAALRLVAERLTPLRDIQVGVLERPQSRTNDFYRELGDIFGVKLKPHNRWGGFRALRERWRSYMASSCRRPVLLIDEAQEMSVEVLSELRLLLSADFDTNSLLTVVFAGDERFLSLLRHEDLVPLGTRIRARLKLEAWSREELLSALEHLLEKAGNTSLFNREVKETLVDHSGGNLRVVMITAGELLAHALASEAEEIDERLYFELFDSPKPKRSARARET